MIHKQNKYHVKNVFHIKVVFKKSEVVSVIPGKIDVYILKNFDKI